MPKCLNCKEEIIELYAYSEVVHNFKLDDKGNPLCEGMDYIEGYIGFECPECNEKLFDTEQEAITFLEDKDELQKLVKEKIDKINQNDKEKRYTRNKKENN